MHEHEHTPSRAAMVAAFGVDQPLTMSSREIAELCEKRHDHVMRDIKRMLEELGEVAPKFGGNYIAGNGKENPCFDLPKDLTLTLVAGYNVKLRKRIIDRWLELEGDRPSRPLPDFSDPRVMLGVFQHLQDKVAERDAVIAEQAPKVEALDRIATADGSLSITEAAKALQMRPKDLFAWLRSSGWIYRRTGASHDLGYQSKVTSGLLEHKVTTVYRSDGSEKITEQVRVTPKGLSRLAVLIRPALQLI